jgi:hypothetical protein
MESKFSVEFRSSARFSPFPQVFMVEHLQLAEGMWGQFLNIFV